MSTTIAVIITTVVMGISYLALLPSANAGYGYMGHRGYHHGPSFWYFGGPSTYHGTSARSGSISGPNNRGGGPGSGK
jgi:hypothetical protein